MELLDALRTTGAVRGFTDEPVPPEVLTRVLDSARFAPSGGNRQPWHVVVIDDAASRARLRELVQAGWREYAALEAAGQRAFGLSDHGRWPGPGDVDLSAARAQGRALPFVDDLDQVPVLLAVLVHLPSLAAVDVELDRHGVAAGASIYPFCWSILLAARSEGLGGVLTTFAVRREPEVLELLGAPEGWALAAVVALGHPQHQPTRLRRREVAEFATVDRFDGREVGA